MLDEGAIISKVQYMHGRHRRRCGRHKCEGLCVLPGEVCSYALIATFTEREMDV